MNKFVQFWQKNNTDQGYFSLRFLIAGIILSAAFLLLFAGFNKTYTSSMVVFANAKSEAAAQQKDQIIKNISEFPKTLALYDRLLKYNKDVKDIVDGKSPAERKNYWNNLVSTQKIGKNSSLIKISITAKQENDAEQLVKKTTETLSYFTAFYYDIKNDLDLRIIENPITQTNIAGWYWTMPLSIALGFLIAFFFQYIFIRRKDSLISKYNESKERFLANLKKEADKTSTQEEIKLDESPYLINIPLNMRSALHQKQENKADSGIQEMKKITKTLEKDKKYPNFPEVPKSTQVTASAPDNLPIADDYFFAQMPPKTEQLKEIERAGFPEKKIHPEPDQEQLKKRLNDLLRGEL